MSRHDEVLKRVEIFLKNDWEAVTADALVLHLYRSLREEVEAHDKTRDDRNTKTERIVSLMGNVRGLESKVSALQAELEDYKKYGFAHGAASYHEGYVAGLVAARAAIEALEK